MDNLSAHKVPGVRERIEASGAELLYLPPYSPDFNPIEQCWAKVKQSLRSAQARTLDVLEAAITQALASITPQNASAWFSHCGYRIQKILKRSSTYVSRCDSGARHRSCSQAARRPSQ